MFQEISRIWTLPQPKTKKKERKMTLLHSDMPIVKRRRQVEEMIHGVASRCGRRAWPRRLRLGWGKPAYEAAADDEAATQQMAIFGMSYSGSFFNLKPLAEPNIFVLADTQVHWTALHRLPSLPAGCSFIAFSFGCPVLSSRRGSRQ